MRLLTQQCPINLVATDAHLGGAWGGTHPCESLIKGGYVQCVIDINQSPVHAVDGVGVFL